MPVGGFGEPAGLVDPVGVEQRVGAQRPDVGHRGAGGPALRRGHPAFGQADGLRVEGVQPR